MGFFDLNIPYLDPSQSGSKAATGNKTSRIKIVTKAMELGYTGIAYNHSVKGVMADKDRCSIPLLTVGSLVKAAPPLASSVGFHRDLLGVPHASPFRQYTRVTVFVESNAHCQALNSGNPILKGYDIVAARPLNQNAFDYACEKAEVDLISIDFSDKMPFRLKLPMVKVAIQRGVYFEITYSDLLMDAQVRRQVISNAKLMVDWTRGKNLIISSGAPSVTEFRGPNDVANLSSLLGLSTERAKAALSKNCRNMIANTLKKKHFYKGAIRVELVSSNDQLNPEQPFAGEWLKWDPLSSGEGDVLLDDLAKAFNATANVVPKMGKAIDFASVVDSMPSHGFQVKDIIMGVDTVPLPPSNNKEGLHSYTQMNQVSEQPLTAPTPPINTLLETHTASGENCQNFCFNGDIMTATSEKELFPLNKCSFRLESSPLLQIEEPGFQTFVKAMKLDSACDENAQVPLVSSECSPAQREKGSSKDFQEEINARPIAVDKFMMDLDKTCDMSLHRHVEEKHATDLGNVIHVGDHIFSRDSFEEMKLDDSSAANHEYKMVVQVEDQKHDASFVPGEVDPVREPKTNHVKDTVVSDQVPYSDSNGESKVIEVSLVSQPDAHEEMIVEDKNDEEIHTTETNHEISIQSSGESSKESSGKSIARKRITNHSHFLPYNHFVNRICFKRRGKRSKRR